MEFSLFSPKAARSAGRRFLLLTSLGLALLVSACGPVNSPRPGTNGSENTLYSPFSGRSPKTLDPAVSYSSDETAYVYSIYEPPYQYHYLKRPYEVVPLTAVSLAAPRYFDKAGRELTAEDYVYAIKRIASPRVVSPAFSTLSSHIIGLREMRDAIRREDAAEHHPAFLDLRKIPFPENGVSAPDPYTLVIRIRGKYPQFQDWLTMSFFAPVPWEAEAFYANPGFKENSIGLAWWPVGTGPYMMTAYEENRRHVLSRNPDFHFSAYPCEGAPGDREKGLLADCGKPLPFIDRIVFTMEKEAIPLRTKFLQGYYDSPAIDRSDVGQGFLVEAADSPELAREYAEKKIQFPRTVDLSNGYLGFNMMDPVVGAGKTPEEAARHRALRQAISIAIDWEEEIAIFQKDQAIPLMGPIPPGIDPRFNEMNPVVYRMNASGRPARRSLADARALMVKAGYPGGRDLRTGRPLTLALDFQQSASDAKPLLDWYQKQFAKLGIQLEIRATDYNRFQDKMIRGSDQIFLWGWLADYPDPENFLSLLYGPNAKAVTKGSGENAANYRSPEFDRLFDRMKYLDEGPEKDAVVQKMIQIVQEDAPWSFGYAPRSAAAYHQWVGNAKPSAMVRNSLQYLKLDTPLRAEKIREWNQPVWWPLILLALGGAAAAALLIRAVKKRSRLDAFGRDTGKEKS